MVTKTRKPSAPVTVGQLEDILRQHSRDTLLMTVGRHIDATVRSITTSSYTEGRKSVLVVMLNPKE